MIYQALRRDAETIVGGYISTKAIGKIVDTHAADLERSPLNKTYHSSDLILKSVSDASVISNHHGSPLMIFTRQTRHDFTFLLVVQKLKF